MPGRAPGAGFGALVADRLADPAEDDAVGEMLLAFEEDGEDESVDRTDADPLVHPAAVDAAATRTATRAASRGQPFTVGANGWQ
jgi:hypothetical protein